MFYFCRYAKSQRSRQKKKGEWCGCERFMSGYQIGLEDPLLDFEMRKYHGHRVIPSELKDRIREDFKLKQEENNKKKKVL